MLKSSTFSEGRDGSELPSWVRQRDGRGAADQAGSSEILEVREAAPQPPDRRPSVRDLASKFEKGKAAAAAKVPSKNVPIEMKGMQTDHVRGREAKAIQTDQVSSTDTEFQTLRRLLTDLKGRLAGRNKDDADRALGIVEVLEVSYPQPETELNEAKAIYEDALSAAHAEIEAARETITKLENDLEEREQSRRAPPPTDVKELEELKREAGRIKMLHESSRAVDTEHQINSLRQQLAEKAAEADSLRKEVDKLREQRRVGAKSPLQMLLAGEQRLGSTLSIVPMTDPVLDLSHCSIQWYQLKPGGPADLISGAIRPQYAPEPLDVGRHLRAEISLPDGKTQAVQTSDAIEPARGLDSYVESLSSKGGAQFNVRIVLKNGETAIRQQLHTFDVSKTRIKLHKGHTVKAREIYSKSMQLCGARGGGDSAAQGLFWVAKKDQTFMLVMESVRERNAAIMLAREFAKLHNVRLGGPVDLTQPEE